MTVSEMITNFLLEYDRVASLSAPGVESDEIIRFLEKAQLELVSQLFAAKQYMLIDNLFETATFATGDLTAWNSVTGAKSLALDKAPNVTRYLFYVGSYSKTLRTAAPVISSGVTVQNQEISKEESKYYLPSAFNMPIFRFPKCFVEGLTLVVIPDGYSSISDIYVDYVMQPQPLYPTTLAGHVTTCELKELLHDQVVAKAVQLAMTATDPQRAAITTQIQNKQ